AHTGLGGAQAPCRALGLGNLRLLLLVGRQRGVAGFRRVRPDGIGVGTAFVFIHRFGKATGFIQHIGEAEVHLCGVGILREGLHVQAIPARRLVVFLVAAALLGLGMVVGGE